MSVSISLLRAATLACLASIVACAGEVPAPVFASGNSAEPTGTPGALLPKIRTARANAAGKKPTRATPVPVAPKLDPELLKAIAETHAYRLGAPNKMTPTPDGRAVLFLRSGPRDPKQSLFKLDVGTGEVRELLSPEKLTQAPESVSAEERARRERLRVRTTGLTTFEISPDGLAILVPYGGRVFVFDRMNGQTRELPTGTGAALDPKLSPDGKRVAYVRGWDVWAIDLDGKGREVRLTRGGTETKPNGLAEFVAQEELDRPSGFFWSPDSKQIAFEEADQTGVERLALANLARPEQGPQHSYYPRAGHANAQVRFGVVAVREGATPVWIQWDRAKLPYVAAVRWDPSAPLVLHVLDREQRHGQLLAVDAASGKTKSIADEHDDLYLDADDSVPRFLPNGRDYLWSTVTNGETVLELRSLDTPAGAPGRTITAKGAGYRALLDVDAERGRAIVAASAEPSESGVFAVPLSGGTATAVGTSRGTVRATFGRSHDVYASYEADLTHYPSTFAVAVDGKKRVPIPSLAEHPTLAPNIELLQVEACNPISW